MNNRSNTSFILIGPSKSGKTTLGKILARALHLEWIDTDLNVKKLYNCLTDRSFLIKNIYSREGDEKFRSLETLVIRELRKQNSVISLGGGSLNNKENVKHLKKLGKFIYLKPSFEVLWERVRLDYIPGYLSNTVSNSIRIDFKRQFFNILRRRVPLYEKLADITIATDCLSPKEIIKALKHQIMHGE
ncbi:MAG: shikimate kinase [Victivallaceae bacterium]